MRRPILAAVLAIVPLVALAACGDDDTGSAPEETAPSTTTTLGADDVLAECTPAQSEDFVAIERHLANGAQHLGEGFSSDQPDGHYVIANVYSVDDQLLAAGLVWRLEGVGGAASSATLETSAYDRLPDAPDASVPQALRDCLAAALTAG